MRVQVRDGVIEASEPEGLYAFVDVPFRKWRVDLPYS